MIKVLIISGGHIKAHNSISSGDNIYKEISNSIYKKNRSQESPYRQGQQLALFSITH